MALALRDLLRQGGRDLLLPEANDSGRRSGSSASPSLSSNSRNGASLDGSPSLWHTVVVVETAHAGVAVNSGADKWLRRPATDLLLSPQFCN